MKAIILYHNNCIDGLAAAWAARHGLKDEYKEIEYIACDYHRPLSHQTIESLAGAYIYIVDFSFDVDTLEQIAKTAEFVVLYDHHKTAFEKLAPWVNLNTTDSEIIERTNYFILLDNTRSGAGIAWDRLPGGQRPKLINYVEDYDLWRFALPHSKEISRYIRFKNPKTVDDMEWLATALENDDYFVEFVHIGGALLTDQMNRVEKAASNARAITILGYSGFASNATPDMASDLGNALATKGSSTFGMVWSMVTPDEFAVSFRANNECDVTTFAKAFGGGGHKNAAGCTMTRKQLFEVLV